MNLTVIQYNSNVAGSTFGQQRLKMQRGNGALSVIKMKKITIKSCLSNRGFRSRKQMKNYNKDYLLKLKELTYKIKVTIIYQ